MPPDRNTTYRILFNKYVRRIVLALVVFGLPMCIVESVFAKENIEVSFVNFVTGHSWAHMWYLYMLIGLYLLTPLLKEFVLHTSRQTMLIAFCTLFVMCSILPTMEHFGIPLKSWMMIPNNPYLLLYMLGYYLVYIEDGTLKKWHLLLVLFACVFIISFKLSMGVDYNLYYDPVSLTMSIAIFLLFKRLDYRWTVADKLNPYCFGLYLVHPVFLNLLAKVIHSNPADYVTPWKSIPLLCIFVFLLSLMSCYVLRKIPFLKSYVL